MTPENIHCTTTSAGTSLFAGVPLCAVNNHPPPQRRYTDLAPEHRFTLMNLPKFDPAVNILIFLKLFKLSLNGESDNKKSTKVLNLLNAASINLIIHHMPEENWMYANAKPALLKIICSIGRLQKERTGFRKSC